MTQLDQTVAGELIALKNEAALAGDQDLNVPLNEVRRLIKFYRGRSRSRAYERLKERIAEDLYGEKDPRSREKARKESLTASVRRTVEAELQSERAELEAVAAALHGREAAVAERAPSSALLQRTLRRHWRWAGTRRGRADPRVG